MFDDRTNLTARSRTISEFFQDQVFQTIIPTASTRLVLGQPIISYDPIKGRKLRQTRQGDPRP